MNFSRVLVHVLVMIGTASIAGHVFASDGDPIAVEINQTFAVQMDNVKDCNSAKPLDQINLLINGIDTGLHAIGCDPATGKLIFELKRDPAQNTAASNAVWETMLGRSWKDVQTKYVRQLSYTVTQPADKGIETLHSGKLNLHMWESASLGVGASIILMVWGALWVLAKYTGLVRDAGNSGTALVQRPYSLGRAQMAWWFAIIVGSYVFLWALTGEAPVLSPQALGLMGLSGATGLVAAGLDAGKQTASPVSSGKFFIDLLTDADGVTIYRFQMLVMTIILGIFFFIHVLNHLTMPEFDANMLTLLGISSGTYAGFKIPERHGPPPGLSETPPLATVADGPKLEYAPAAATSG